MVIAGVVLSFAIGVSLGVFGGGGSILTVPVLYDAFGLSAHRRWTRGHHVARSARTTPVCDQPAACVRLVRRRDRSGHGGPGRVTAVTKR